MIRVGQGYDVHQLVPKRKLILGGVLIDFHLGLKGHSDADVLLHALIDSILCLSPIFILRSFVHTAIMVEGLLRSTNK